MKKTILITTALLSFSAFSAEPSQDWLMFCGDKESFLKHAERQFGGKPTSKELRELNQSRLPLLKVLAGGAKALQELLHEGDRNDTGPFGLLMTCGMIVNLKHEITEKGCYSLTSKTPIRDKGGIKACEDILSKFPKS